MKPGKVYISGTGRSGTTFLVIILSYLGLDTGFDRESIHKYIYENCNSGLDKQFDEPYYILKSPAFLNTLDRILDTFTIDHMFIPLRNLKSAAASRARHRHGPGGFWEARTYEEQLRFFEQLLTNYEQQRLTHNIPTTYIDFSDMITSPEYLHQKLSPLLRDIPYKDFLEAYQYASAHQKKSLAD